MLDRISVTDSYGDLGQKVWTFWFNDRDTLVLDTYKVQVRATKRHKWMTQDLWTRQFARDCTIERPAVPDWVKVQVKADLLAQMESILKVEK